MQRRTNKKGLIGINQLSGIVLIILLIGIMLIVGTRIQGDIKTDMDDTTSTITLTNSTTNVPVNETTGAIWPSGIWKNPGSLRSCSLTVTGVTNATGTFDQIIDPGNYTVTNCYLTFTSVSSVDAGSYNNTFWNITGSASYPTDSVEYNAASHAQEGITSVAENQGLLGTVIVFGVIISVVVVAFAFGRGGF